MSRGRGNASFAASPVLIGATTVGAPRASSAIVRRCLLPALLLLALVSGLTMLAASGVVP